MRKWLLSAGAGFVGAVFAFSSFALAAQSPAAPAGAAAANTGGQGLEISPPVVELRADPGQTVTANIRVRNVTKGELVAKGRADDFGAGSEESGQPKILLDETGATRYSLKFWVSGVPDLRLAPQELKNATVKITIPANAEPGGHFGVVRFTAMPPDLDGTGVALSASVGALILLKVSGVVTEKMSVVEFSSKQSGQTKHFFEHGPVEFVVRAKNEGSVHEKLKGDIVITDTFGKKAGSVVVNEKGGNILPDSIRRFDQTLNKKQLFGHYKATLALSYSDGKKLTATTSFWVIPWKLILLALIGLVVVFLLLRLALRRYNEHIIAQARRRR